MQNVENQMKNPIINIYIYIFLTTSEKAMVKILFLIFNNVYSVTLFKIKLIDQYKFFFSNSTRTSRVEIYIYIYIYVYIYYGNQTIIE